MTREEEIQNLIDEEMGIDNYGSLDFQVGVDYGVKYADKTMIDKACEWLWIEIYARINDPEIKESLYNDNYHINLVAAFREAMEGE